MVSGRGVVFVIGLSVYRTQYNAWRRVGNASGVAVNALGNFWHFLFGTQFANDHYSVKARNGRTLVGLL